MQHIYMCATEVKSQGPGEIKERDKLFLAERKQGTNINISMHISFMKFYLY